MKKIISAITVAILVCSLFSVNTFGQFSSIYVAIPSVADDAPVSKNRAKAEKAARKMEISHARAEKSFKKNFSSSATVQWVRVDKLILATFKEDGVATRITYNNSGDWFRTIKDYKEAKLNESVITLIKNSYKGYEIKAVSEVNEHAFHCYFINVQKGKDFKQLLVYDGEVHIYKQFKVQ